MSTYIFSRYEYGNIHISNNFSVKDLDLSSGKSMKIARQIKDIFLDSNGTFYILVCHKNRYGRVLCSYVKKIHEDSIFDLKLKVDYKNDLKLDDITIDKFIVHLNKIYLLDCENKRVLVYTTDFKEEGEIKIEINKEIRSTSQNLMFIIHDYVVITINSMIFLWKIDSKNTSFVAVNNNGVNHFSFNSAVHYEENKFICNSFRSENILIFEIENIENSPTLNCLFYDPAPGQYTQKNSEVFKFLDGRAYFACFENEKDLTIKNLDAIVKCR